MVGVNAHSEKWHSMPYRLAETFVRMELKFEASDKIFNHGGDFPFEVGKVGGGDDEIEIINIATVRFDLESIDDELVELIKIDVGHELRGEIADDNTFAWGLTEETFTIWQLDPTLSVRVTANYAMRRVVKNSFSKEITEHIIERSAFVVLTFESPDGAFVETAAGKTHEVALDVKFDNVGFALEIL